MKAFKSTATHAPETLSAGVYIALGSNLGDRATMIRAALTAIDAHPDIAIRRVSSVCETEPVGGPPNQRNYHNAVAEIATRLAPTDLLATLLEIEARLGRKRSGPNAPRTIDLDLLLFRDQHINQPGLIVPHPRMWRRSFVLDPLAELCDLAALRARFDAFDDDACRSHP